MIPVEHFVSVSASVLSLGDTTKAVQVELSLKGCQLGVAKVTGEYVSYESFRVADGEGVATRQPGHNGGIFLFQHFHQLAWEWIRS